MVISDRHQERRDRLGPLQSPSYAPNRHGHSVAEVTGLQSDLADLQTSKASVTWVDNLVVQVTFLDSRVRMLSWTVFIFSLVTLALLIAVFAR